MSESFNVASSTGGYAVEILPGGFRRFLGERKNIVAICDERFATDLEQAGVKAIPLHSDESAKNLSAIPAVITALMQAGTTRETSLLALGGGIPQDVAAFCAAIYRRGLDWVYVPTTLLGMADSCIGGKSSINVGDYKNIVGTFNPPKLVLIDPEFAATLPSEHIVAGLIEAAKISYCRGGETWKAYLACRPSPDLKGDGLTRVIATSLRAKKWFIEIDEFDRKERLLLNFGHTFGHAVEGASGFRVSHGIAVGVGILCALTLGRFMGTSYEAVPRVGELRSHVLELLRAVASLPDALRGIEVATLFDCFVADKKHKTEAYQVVAVAADGCVELISLPKTDGTRSQIVEAMEEVLWALRDGSTAAA